jgi:hypothetical protein
MLEYLTNTTENFGGRTFVVAVHEEHPFVFFDCDTELAICGYSTQNGGSEACGVRQNIKDPVQCTEEEEVEEVVLNEYSVRMVIALPYAAPASRNSSSTNTSASVPLWDITTELKVREALANALKVSTGAVHINSVTDPASLASEAYGEYRRRLLSAPVTSHVDFSIDAPSLEEAQVIASHLTVVQVNAFLNLQVRKRALGDP